MKKYFGRGCPRKLRINFDDEQNGMRFISRRDLVAMQIASVHAGLARTQTL
jgi:hypothetical protein